MEATRLLDGIQSSLLSVDATAAVVLPVVGIHDLPGFEVGFDSSVPFLTGRQAVEREANVTIQAFKHQTKFPMPPITTDPVESFRVCEYSEYRRTIHGARSLSTPPAPTASTIRVRWVRGLCIVAQTGVVDVEHAVGERLCPLALGAKKVESGDSARIREYFFTAFTLIIRRSDQFTHSVSRIS